jgi:hypothetical protein
MTSMSTKRNNDQAMKPARVVSVGFMFYSDDVSCVFLTREDASFLGLTPKLTGNNAKHYCLR